MRIFRREMLWEPCQVQEFVFRTVSSQNAVRDQLVEVYRRSRHLEKLKKLLMLHAVTPCTPFAGQNKCNSSIAADTVYVVHREIVCSVDRVSLDATSRRPIASASIGVSSNRLEGNACAGNHSGGD